MWEQSSVGQVAFKVGWDLGLNYVAFWSGYDDHDPYWYTHTDGMLLANANAKLLLKLKPSLILHYSLIRTLSSISLANYSRFWLWFGILAPVRKQPAHISVGHHRTLISWESDAESDLAPPELGFSFFLFCFFFFLLAPRSPPGLLHMLRQTHRTSVNGGWHSLTQIWLLTHTEDSRELTLAAIATNDSWANLSLANWRLTATCHYVSQGTDWDY